jgi:hypothetical protein
MKRLLLPLAFMILGCAEAGPAPAADSSPVEWQSWSSPSASAPAKRLPFASAFGGGGGGSGTGVSGIATYSYGDTNAAVVATPTDIWCLAGSATKTVQILRVGLTCSTSATTNQILPLALVARSAADTGSTPVTKTPTQHDQGDPAPTAVFTVYTSTNPSVSGLLGTAGTRKGIVGCAGTGASAADTFVPVVWDFTASGQKPITLRGVAQVACLNGGGGALPAGFVLGYETTWVEQ